MPKPDDHSGAARFQGGEDILRLFAVQPILSKIPARHANDIICENPSRYSVYYSLTAPAVNPLINCLLMIKYKTSTGSADNVSTAITFDQSV